MIKKSELLAPAGSMESLLAALRCGADAVYAGAEQFSARANAENFSFSALKEAAELCHLYGAKLYLAINTLVFEREIPALDALIETAAEIGADGCIVQDLGVAACIAKRCPTLPLHASTQMTIHSPAGVRFAKQAGFSRIVAARELSRAQLTAVCEEARRCEIEVEAFVHGAHCMSVSGQCWMSAVMGGRSANRGCCAQPCRLPFTADNRESANALSLKDMSLLSHLKEMQEIGVYSFKIEGRMKRPEYVAASVTACKQVLNGEQPNLEELRAVFSRSGFTDGYYTNQRSDMFGTRRKEDVTAAQDVLKNLTALYRKPRQCVGLSAHFILQKNTPAQLLATDTDGNTVTVYGDAPQKALNRATDTEQLKKHFQKLGDTIYTMESVTADIEPDAVLPASAINAMRRDAVEQMNQKRILANTPKAVLMPAPLSNPPKKNTTPSGFRLQIRHPEQLRLLKELYSEIEYILIPLFMAEELQKEIPPQNLSGYMLVLPRFYTDETKLITQLKAAKAAGFTHLSCQHAADVQIGKELGFHLHGGPGLHVTNSFALDYYAALSLTDILCSPEIQMHAAPLPMGCIAYGRLPLMLTRNCPIQAQIGCKNCKKCLTDRKGASLYTDCTRYYDAPDYAEIFNPVPIWQADKPELYQKYAYALLYMTNETAEQVREIVLAYLHGKPTDQSFTRYIRLQ
ncbi:MAG: U32 family peptidase [Oscillospiraceae bacterium]|nr:U32 family peptidase [Oscillospiraceae bacterium]